MSKLGAANSPRALAMLLAPLFAIGCGPGDSGGIDPSAAIDLLAASVRSCVTQESLEPHARAIVEHQRPSGSAGENAAIDYVVQTLEAAGVPVEVHSFEAFTSDPISASVGLPGTDRTFDAITASFSASVPGLEAPLVDVGPLEDLPAIEVGTGERLVLEGEDMGGPFAHPYPDLSGSIALVDGLPRNIPTAVLERLGAVGAIFVNPDERVNDLIVTSTWGTPSLLNYHRLPNLPVAHVPRSTGEALRGMLDRDRWTSRCPPRSTRVGGSFDWRGRGPRSGARAGGSVRALRWPHRRMVSRRHGRGCVQRGHARPRDRVPR